MIEALTLLTSLTLAATGIFLYRDYASFLKGAYVKRGRVASIQPTFTNTFSDKKTFIKKGYYPVIEYFLNGEAVRFTAIDHLASARLHVGDKVLLRIIKTRRKACRLCFSLVTLVSLVAALSFTLLSAAFSSNEAFTLTEIFLGSLVLTLSLTILAVYFSDQDQYFLHDLKQTKRGYTQLFLAEPTAYKKWHSAFRDPVQRIKINSSRIFGATFIGSAMAILSFSLSPHLLNSF